MEQLDAVAYFLSAWNVGGLVRRSIEASSTKPKITAGTGIPVSIPLNIDENTPNFELLDML